MFNKSYDELVSIIQEKSGLSKEEIEKRIKEKIDKLSGLISREGAAHIVANELGVQIIEKVAEATQLEIKNIVEGLRNVCVVGKVIRKFEVKSFNRSDNSEGKVGALILADETGSVRVVFWNDHIKEFENIKEGDILDIKNAYARKNKFSGNIELQLNSNSKLTINPEGVELNVDVVNSNNYDIPERKEIKDLSEEDSNVELLATIVSVFDIHFFETCSQCNKRVKEVDGKFICDEHGEVEPVYRAVLNLILDDSTDTIRAVFFNNQIKMLLGLDDSALLELKDNPEKFSEVRNKILGKIIKVVGRTNKNEMFDRLEFVVNLVDPDPNPDEEEI